MSRLELNLGQRYKAVDGGTNTAGSVYHPKHYGGADDPFETIKVIEAWKLGFNLGNTVKYISRAGNKDPAQTVQDLEKARWYLDREIENRKRAGIDKEAK